VAAVSAALAPVGGARLDLGGLRPGGVPVRFTGSLGVDYMVDPILTAAGSRGIASLSSRAAPGGDWVVSVEAMAVASLRSSPLPGNPDETAGSVAASVRRRVSQHAIVELGARGSDHAPNLSAQSFAFHQRAAWVYLTVTVASQPSGRWASQ
jgi:hypothetical protein